MSATETPRAAWRRLLQTYPSMEKLGGDLAMDQAAESTYKIYIIGVMKLVDYLGVDDPDTALKKIQAQPEDHINDFLRWLVSKGYATKYVGTLGAGVKKWLTANNVRVYREHIRRPSTRTVVQDRDPTTKILRKFMEAGKPRTRFLIVCMVSSGLRIGGVANLKLRDLDLEMDPDIVVVHVPHRAAKGYMNSATPDKVLFHTFMSKEARRYLTDYIDYRRRVLGERITDDSPLLGGEYGDTVGRHIPERSVIRLWSRLLFQAGETERSRGWHVYRSHTLRKFFRTACAYAGVPTEFVHKWMGHKQALETEYLRVVPEKDLKFYREAEPHLTISEASELRRKGDKRHAELLAKIDKLERDQAHYKPLDDLLERIKRLEKVAKNGDSNNPGMFG